jgi:hypothetical protein
MQKRQIGKLLLLAQKKEIGLGTKQASNGMK